MADVTYFIVYIYETMVVQLTKFCIGVLQMFVQSCLYTRTYIYFLDISVDLSPEN